MPTQALFCSQVDAAFDRRGFNGLCEALRALLISQLYYRTTQAQSKLTGLAESKGIPLLALQTSD